LPKPAQCLCFNLWKDEAATWIRRGMRDQKVDHPSKLKPRRLYGSLGWNLMEPFKPGPDDVVIDKRRPSMFVGNEFETILHNRGATTVVMVGCTTDGGVEMTVRIHNRGHSMVIVHRCVFIPRAWRALKRIERFADGRVEKLIEIWKVRRNGERDQTNRREISQRR
jgi:nicotinamidase-related amidase